MLLHFDNQLLRDAEHHYDLLNFDELYRFTASVCLAKEPEVDTVPDSSIEAQLIQKIGVRGLASAINIVNDGHPYIFHKTEDEEGRLITASLQLRETEFVNGQTDPLTQSRIEALGQGLLGEAYVCLGTDVRGKIQEFKDAETDEDQIEVLEWLDSRIRALDTKTNKGFVDQDEEKHFYHPIRLSPKVLGQYPHHNFNPTCLAISILTSSFLAQTGAERLHAGVMSIAEENNSLRFAELLRFRKNAILTDSTKRRLRVKSDEILKHLSDQAFHAASLVKLKSGAWYILDPNYSASHVMNDLDSEALTQAYDSIDEFSTLAPGIEQVVSVGYMSDAKMATYGLLFAELPPLNDDAAMDLLQPPSIEEFQPLIRHYVQASIKNAVMPLDRSEKYHTRTVERMEEEYNFDNHNRRNTLFDEAFDNAWTAFFLYDEDPQSIVQRVLTDSAYAQRRIEDLQALPYLTYLHVAKIMAEAREYSASTDYTHIGLEVGSPAYRIGAAVLSDFASYCGNNLSYSFWTAHWPGLISLTEHRAQAQPHELKPVLVQMSWLHQLTLIYSKQYDMVKKFG